MKTILLTGGSGFIGRNVIEHYRESNEFRIIAPTSKELDCSNQQCVYNFLKNNKIDYVLNFAVPNNEQSMLDTGLRMYHNFASNSDLFDKMICTGSGAEYDKKYNICSVREDDIGKNIPTDSYGLMKYTVNQMIENSDNIYNFRLFGIFGKYEMWQRRFISNICCKSIFDLPLTMRQNVFFDYLFIDDFLAILNAFLHLDCPNFHSYNIVSGKRIDLLSLCHILNEVTEKNNRIIICNEGLANEYTASNKRLLAEIPISFTSLEDSVKAMYDYYISIKETLDLTKLFY